MTLHPCLPVPSSQTSLKSPPQKAIPWKLVYPCARRRPNSHLSYHRTVPVPLIPSRLYPTWSLPWPVHSSPHRRNMGPLRPPHTINERARTCSLVGSYYACAIPVRRRPLDRAFPGPEFSTTNSLPEAMMPTNGLYHATYIT